jgi:S1-C subfamily serine protease
MRPEVCAGIEIHFESGDVYMAELVASDPRADVAVLKILPFSHDKPLPKFQYLKPGRSSQLVRGEWVAALGAMLGGLLTFSQGTLAKHVYFSDPCWNVFVT